MGVHIITSKVKSYGNQLWIKPLNRDGQNFVSFQIFLLILIFFLIIININNFLIFTMLNSDISNDQKKNVSVICQIISKIQSS